MGLQEYIGIAGLVALSFGAGVEYTKMKANRMPVGIAERDGEYYVVDRLERRNTT